MRMLMETERAKPPNPKPPKERRSLDDTDDPPTLAELGLTKRESADAQLLRETERAKGNLKVGPVVPAGDHGKPTLAELGLSKRESADAQLLAELPAEDFEKIKAGKKTRAKAKSEVT